MPPGLIGVMKDLFGKLLEFFDADCSDGFSNGLTPLLVESFGVDEFIEWHKVTLLVECRDWQCVARSASRLCPFLPARSLAVHQTLVPFAAWPDCRAEFAVSPGRGKPACTSAE